MKDGTIMHKKIISIDFDGVLNDYNGNYSNDTLPSLKKGASTFLKKLSKNYTITIFTARDKDSVSNWLKENNLIKYIKDITNTKNPFSSIILDDRAICFEGDFKKAYRQIMAFKPY